jgi:hypothetical protein
MLFPPLSSGSSGGKRNSKSKYHSVVVGGGGGSSARKGPPVNLRQKLADIDAESAWFDARPAGVREQLVRRIVQMLEKQVSVAQSHRLHRSAAMSSWPAPSLIVALCFSAPAVVAVVLQFRHAPDVVLPPTPIHAARESSSDAIQ